MLGHMMVADKDGNTALERQDLCCMYLAHYDLESNLVVVVIVMAAHLSFWSSCSSLAVGLSLPM